MKISAETLAVLKNFSTLGNSITINPGNVLRHTSKGAVLAEAVVTEQFPVTVAIYDLPHFLAVVKMFESPEFGFERDYVRIRDLAGSTEVKYLYAAPSLLRCEALNRVPRVPVNAVTFDLSEEQLTALQKGASLLNKTEMQIVFAGDEVRVAAYNHRNPDSHSFSVTVPGSGNGLRCSTIVHMANLMLLSGPYSCTVTQNYVLFERVGTQPLRYWVACEPSSEYSSSP